MFGVMVAELDDRPFGPHDTLERLFDAVKTQSGWHDDLPYYLYVVAHSEDGGLYRLAPEDTHSNDPQRIRALRHCLRSIGATHYVVGAECYISADDERREVLLMVAADAHGQSIGGYFDILRDSKGKGRLGTWHDAPDAHGDFARLLVGGEPLPGLPGGPKLN
jgi:hypothetical protein